jgi:hypothetical protein
MPVRKIVIGAITAGTLVVASAAAVAATSAPWVSHPETTEHFSLKAGTVLTGTLKAKTTLSFKGADIDGIPVTVTCTGFSASGPIPAAGLTVTLSAAPKITGCKDQLGGTDTVATNVKNGKWTLTEIDVSGTADNKEPNTGDKVSLTMPKAGATFASTLLTGCLVTVAPTKAASLTGPFNDVTTISDSKAGPLPVAGNSKCTTSGSASATGTIILNKAVHDEP